MIIVVRLHTILQRGGHNQLELDLPVGSTIRELINILDIALSLEDIIIVVNNHSADIDQILKEQDVVHLIPAISGG